MVPLLLVCFNKNWGFKTQCAGQVRGKSEKWLWYLSFVQEHPQPQKSNGIDLVQSPFCRTPYAQSLRAMPGKYDKYRTWSNNEYITVCTSSNITFNEYLLLRIWYCRPRAWSVVGTVDSTGDYGQLLRFLQPTHCYAITWADKEPAAL